MNKLDDAIRQALSAEDAALLKDVGGEQALHSQLLQTFRGTFGWMNAVGYVAGFALFAVFVVAIWKFAEASEVHDMLAWGGGAVIAASGLGLVKLWFWMELQKNAVVREVKRLELQVARLTARLDR